MCNLPPSAPIVAGSVVAARRHHALPSPQDISTTSLLTIPGAVEARGLGDCSRDPLFQGRCEIAILQPEVDGPSHSTWRPNRTRPHASAAIRTGAHWDQPPGVAVGGKDDRNGRLSFRLCPGDGAGRPRAAAPLSGGSNSKRNTQTTIEGA